MRRNWIKLWVNQTLRGTLKKEFTYDERWSWPAMLLMCGDGPFSPFIAVTERVGYTDEQIADFIDMPIDIFLRCKAKMIKYKKIEVYKNNIIKILNWKKYQPEYERQKEYRLQGKYYYDNKEECLIFKELQTKVTGVSTNESHNLEEEGEGEGEGEGEVKDRYMSTTFKNNVISKWNELAQKRNLPAIKEIKRGSLREKNLRARRVEKDFDFDLLIDIIENSPFLLGKTKDPFFVFFDWIIKPTNYQKIIEGNYLDRRSYQKFAGIIEGIKEMAKKDKRKDKDEN